MEIVLGLVVFFLVIGLPYVLKNHRQNILYNHVTFLSTKSNDASGRYGYLASYVNRQQDFLKIENNCRLQSPREWEFVKNIISDCAKNVSSDFLEKKFEPSKALADLTSEEFFFAQLYLYLWNFELEKKSTLLGCPLWFASSESHDHVLTEDGITFYKLTYIACKYCQQNSRINNIKTGVWISNDGPDLYRYNIICGKL